MRLSFDDTESFKEMAGSLRFNYPPSDSNASDGEERSEDTLRYDDYTA